MSGEPADAEATRHTGTGTALVAGLVGGLVGTAAFGLVTNLLDLGFVRSFVPALFGLPQAGVLGWAIHLATGAVLGVVFGLLVSLEPVADVLVPDVEEPQLGPTGMLARLTGAGIVYGLAVWALLPTVALPLWLGIVGTAGVESIPGTPLETLAAHLVFGTLLGVVFAVVATRR